MKAAIPLTHRLFSINHALTLSIAVAAGTANCSSPEPGNRQMTCVLLQSEFGKMSDGTEVKLYTLKNQRGLVAKITNYGAILTELHVPDRNGRTANVVLGFDNLEQYTKGHPGFGATIGRVANRIAKGTFTLDGKDYTLALNNGPNHLHGGIKGFDKSVWKSRPLHCTASEAAVEFSYLSRDSEEGYPGNLSVTVVYTLTSKNELRID